MRELSFEDSREKVEPTVFVPRSDSGFLVAQPLYFKNSVIGQYAKVHHRKDIRDYASLAIEIGVLDKGSASEFLKERQF